MSGSMFNLKLKVVGREGIKLIVKLWLLIAAMIS